MQTKRRWMTSVITEAKKTEVQLPWARQNRVQRSSSPKAPVRKPA